MSATMHTLGLSFELAYGMGSARAAMGLSSSM